MRMTINDIEDKETVLIIRIPNSKNGIERYFTILNPANSIDYLSYIRKYISLRPRNVNTSRLFLKYTQNNCTKQPIGINTFGKMPSVIASYLNLPNPSLYTGHSFRRSSATILANSGGDLLTVKKHGGWKSSAVAEGYIDTTLNKKIDVSNKLLRVDAISSNVNRVNDMPDMEISNMSIFTPENSAYNSFQQNDDENINKLNNSPRPSTSTDINTSNIVCENSNLKSTLNKAQGLNFNNCTNCTFNIHIVHN